MSNSQLSVEIVCGKLVIEIGISTLGFAVQHSNYFNQFEKTTITNLKEFAEAIREELLNEEEDGSTLVHRMLDKAAEEAVENGCEGVEVEVYE